MSQSYVDGSHPSKIFMVGSSPTWKLVEKYIVLFKNQWWNPNQTIGWNHSYQLQITYSIWHERFAFIYYSDTARGKKFLPRSEFGIFLGMDSSTRLIKVYLPQTKKIRTVRQTDFRIYVGDILSGVEAMLDSIAREAELEREATKANSKKCLPKVLLRQPRKYLVNAWRLRKRRLIQRSEIFLRGLPIQRMEWRHRPWI